jgi:2'-5' RNA ligase
MSTTQLAGVASAFALVAYIPGALGAFIDDLSASLPGESRGRSHLTLLPPRPLTVAPHAAGELLSAALSNFPPFEVGLTEISRFPVTDVLYIALGEGVDEARRAHVTLNRGPFAYQEPFEYRPHVTLMVPREKTDVDTLQRAATTRWTGFKSSKRFLVDRLDFLGQGPGGAWEKLRQIRLAGGEL